jgi:hypothetical protein
MIALMRKGQNLEECDATNAKLKYKSWKQNKWQKK